MNKLDQNVAKTLKCSTTSHPMNTKYSNLISPHASWAGVGRCYSMDLTHLFDVSDEVMRGMA